MCRVEVELCENDKKFHIKLPIMCILSELQVNVSVSKNDEA